MAEGQGAAGYPITLPVHRTPYLDGRLPYAHAYNSTAGATSNPQLPTSPASAKPKMQHPAALKPHKKGRIQRGKPLRKPTDSHPLLPEQHLRSGIACSKGVKDLTSPIPIVGSVTEGIGNAPVAQKIGGQEEERGYLGAAYKLAGEAVRTVYDAAGNVVSPPPPLQILSTHTAQALHIRMDGEADGIISQIGTVSNTAGTYLHGNPSTKASEEPASKEDALAKDQEVLSKKKATETTQDAASSLGGTASEASDKLTRDPRGIEENVEANSKAAFGQVQHATGTTHEGDAGGVAEGVKGTAGSVGEGANRVATGSAETVKGGVGALGSGAKGLGGGLGLGEK